MWMKSTLDTKNIDTDSLAYYIGSTYSKTPLFVFNSSTLTAQLKLKNPDLELSNLFVYVYKLKQRVLIPDRRAANKILSKIS